LVCPIRKSCFGDNREGLEILIFGLIFLGPLLEGLGRRALVARFGEQLLAEQNQTLAQKLPFLTGTLLGSKKCPTNISTKNWPKMVLKGAKSRSLLSKDGTGFYQHCYE
jgi:hypothetical protein